MNSILNWKKELPKGWEAIPLKAVAFYSVSSVDKLTKEDEIHVELCNYVDVYKNDFIVEELEFMNATATEDEITNYSLEIGDVLITKDSESFDDIGIPALVAFTKKNLLCGYHLAMIKPIAKRINSKFLFRCIQSKEIRIQLELASTGVTRFGLPKDEIGRLMLPVPEIGIQNKIVDFLDSEISRIDLLILAKEKLLDRLAEKRKALINNSVTKGLNPKIKMKDSDIEWLGKVPAHWEVERTRWLFKEKNERSETGKEKLLTVSHITGVTLRSEKDVNMFEAETTEGYKKCDSGDLVINTLWAWMGAMGVSPLDGIVSPAYHVYTPNKRILPEYIDLIVRLPIFAKEVTRYSKGVWSSRLRLYPEGFYEVYMPVPPTHEQTKIGSFIRVETNKIDSIVKAAKQSIELLIERRGSLINAAVTGQLIIS